MQEASDHISWGTGWAFAHELADGRVREQMLRAGGNVPGMRSIVCHPDEPIGEALRRVDQVEGDGPVFVAVRDGDGWVMLTVPKPVRTEERS